MTPYVRKQRKRQVNAERQDAQAKLAKKAEAQNKAISDAKKPAEKQDSAASNPDEED